MAHLEVEPKPSRPWWIWALLVIILITLAIILLKKSAAQPDSATGIRKADTNVLQIAVATPEGEKCITGSLGV